MRENILALDAILFLCSAKYKIGGRMLDAPQVVDTQDVQTAVIHLTVPRDEIRTVMEPAIQEVVATLAAQRIVPAGPLFSYHLRTPCDIFDLEVGFPVAKPVTPMGRVKMSELPATKVVRAYYHGDYEGLGRAWGEFGDWMDAKGFTKQETLWEIYTTGPESSPNPEDWRTELNRPIKA